jgi:EAL domain-containing protein (putative c-di-GMP-specific phosphodiesterase class I)
MNPLPPSASMYTPDDIMAEKLPKMTVIAEGVETQKQLDCPKIMGCDEFQGYQLGRPIPIDEYSSLVFLK